MPAVGSMREILAGPLGDVDAIANNKTALRQLAADLRETERRLAARLRGVSKNAGDMRFTEAQAHAFEGQVQLAVKYAEARLLGATHDQAVKAIQRSLTRTVTTMNKLDKFFTGVVTPLQIGAAAQLIPLGKRAKASALASSKTSVDRYGQGMIGEFQAMIRLGLLQGLSTDDMIGALTGHGGPRGTVSMSAKVTPKGVIRTREEDIPEGLFVRHRYWAERIVRTETLRAYNGARQLGFVEMKGQFPDLQKKIIAILDPRTAADSIAVNGQVRDIGADFVDGAGRHYLYPPARPNDRETTIPWRPSWTDKTEDLGDYERAILGELTPEEEQGLIDKLTKKPEEKRPKEKKARKGKPDRFAVEVNRGGSWTVESKHKTIISAWRDANAFRDSDLHARLVSLENGLVLGEAKPEDRQPKEKLKPLKPGPVTPAAPKVAAIATVSPPAADHRARIVAWTRASMRETTSLYGDVVIDVAGKTRGSVFASGRGWKAEHITTATKAVDMTEELGVFPTKEAAIAATKAAIEADASRKAHMVAANFSLTEMHRVVATAAQTGDWNPVRYQVLGILTAHGVAPTSIWRDDPAQLTMRINDQDVAAGAAGHHAWEGEVVLKSHAAKGIEKMFENGISASNKESLSLLIHEELHGATPWKSNAFYAGFGATIEEVTVEMAARKITSLVTGTPMPGFGAYQPEINGIMNIIRQEMGPRANATDLISSAGIKMRSPGGGVNVKPIEGQEEILDLFVYHLDATDDEKQRIKARILAEIGDTALNIKTRAAGP
jgi:hypothetical protein